MNECACQPFSASVRVCVHSCMSAHTSIMSLWSLQSNSFRQKSLKQPLVSGLHAIPPSVSSLLNSHQPLLLPKITQERHSNPRLTTAQLGRKRGIKTHTKKETHHIVEGGGEESIHTAPCLKISTDDFGKQRTTHTNATGQDREKESVFVCTYILDALLLRRRNSFLMSFSQWFNHKLNKNTYIITL